LLPTNRARHILHVHPLLRTHHIPALAIKPLVIPARPNPLQRGRPILLRVIRDRFHRGAVGEDVVGLGGAGGEDVEVGAVGEVDEPAVVFADDRGVGWERVDDAQGGGEEEDWRDRGDVLGVNGVGERESGGEHDQERRCRDHQHFGRQQREEGDPDTARTLSQAPAKAQRRSGVERARARKPVKSVRR